MGSMASWRDLKVQTTRIGKGEHLLDYFVEMSWWAALAYHFHASRPGSLCLCDLAHFLCLRFAGTPREMVREAASWPKYR